MLRKRPFRIKNMITLHLLLNYLHTRQISFNNSNLCPYILLMCGRFSSILYIIIINRVGIFVTMQSCLFVLLLLYPELEESVSPFVDSPRSVFPAMLPELLGRSDA